MYDIAVNDNSNEFVFRGKYAQNFTDTVRITSNEGSFHENQNIHINNDESLFDIGECTVLTDVGYTQGLPQN